MASYAFQTVLVWDTNPGGVVRLLRNGAVTVYNAATDAVLLNLTSDSQGLVSFTTTDVPTIYLKTTGWTSPHITAASAIEASAAFTVSEDAAVATLITPGSGSASEAVLNSTYVAQGNLSVNVKDYGATGDGATDDRGAIQDALDAAGVGGNVYFPPGIYVLGSLTIAGDRILKTYADQTLYGSGRYVSTLKVAGSFGDYRTVIGLLNDSTYCGRWGMADLGIDQNASTSNALTVATMATKPRMAVRLGSYTAGSVVSVRDCAFIDGDSVNAVYVYGDTIDVSGNHFIDQGGPVGTASHDHSSIYTTTTNSGGTQTIGGNTLRGVQGSGGARTGIETHGGTQSVTGNVVSGYATGMNLTGVSTPDPTDGIVCTGNTVKGACIGLHVWSYYNGALTTGVATRNIILSGNSITIDRDAWLGITGFTAYAYGVLVDTSNTAPTNGLTIADNMITFLPITAAGITGDYRSTGINLDIANTAAIVYDLNIRGNTIVNPISAGMYLSGVIKRGRVSDNTVVNPAQSTDASVATVYRSAVLLNRTLEDVGFERNTLIDTRATHYAEYGIVTSGLAVATNCWTRNNVIRYTDGAGVRCAFYPTANTAGAEFFIEESNPGGATPTFNTKAGSKVTRTATGRVLVQTAASVGTTWKDVLALGATTGTTAPSAGAGGALPATPAGYVTLSVNGTDRQVAYY